MSYVTVPRLGGIYAVELGSTVVGGIMSQMVNTGTEMRSEGTSGDVYARSNFIVAQKPGIGFVCKQLKTLLDVTTLMGKNIAALTGGAKVYIQKHAVTGARASGANHRKFTLNQGVLLITSITCDHQADAVATVNGIATYDGTNQPILEADGVSLPTAVSDAERFTLGPVTIGGVAFNGYRRFALEMMMKVEREGAGSEIWDSTVSIRDIYPRFKLIGLDYELLKAANIPFKGKAAAHADTKLYLRKRLENDQFVADGTAAHIKFTAAGSCYCEEPFKGDGNAPGEATFCLETKNDGTNDPVLVNTAIAVT